MSPAAATFSQLVMPSGQAPRPSVGTGWSAPSTPGPNTSASRSRTAYHVAGGSHVQPAGDALGTGTPAVGRHRVERAEHPGRTQRRAVVTNVRIGPSVGAAPGRSPRRAAG